MDSGIVVIAVMGILFVALPGMILHFMTEWRKSKTLSTDDERLIDELWRTAQTLEGRVETLERILDKEAPEWRDKDHADA